MSDGQAEIQLPRWKCHKEVWAAKILRIDDTPVGPRLVLTFDGQRESAYADVVPEWLAKHSPQIGGYYVQYTDGYKSYSPAAAFESGYTRV